MKYSTTYFYSDSDIKLKDAIKFHNFTKFAEQSLYILGNWMYSVFITLYDILLKLFIVVDKQRAHPKWFCKAS